MPRLSANSHCLLTKFSPINFKGQRLIVLNTLYYDPRIQQNIGFEFVKTWIYIPILSFSEWGPTYNYEIWEPFL